MMLITPLPSATEIPSQAAVTFAPMVEACDAHGIRRTTAFKLARDGLLETFLMGRRRFVMLQSLHDLPDRLAKRESDANPAPSPAD